MNSLKRYTKENYFRVILFLFVKQSKAEYLYFNLVICANFRNEAKYDIGKEQNMEQERFMVIDNQKGVVIPLHAEQSLSIKEIKDREGQEDKNVQLEEKVNKIQALIKVLIKQSIKDTIKEYNLQLTEELKEYENYEVKRWEKMEENDEKRWERFESREDRRWKKIEECNEKYWDNMKEMEYKCLERIQKEEEKRWKDMEKHFKDLDKNIRQKQDESKRKKHSIFN